MNNPPLMATHTRRRKCRGAPLGEGLISFSLDEYLSLVPTRWYEIDRYGRR